MGNKDFAAICYYKIGGNNRTKFANQHKEGMRFKGADKVIKRVAFKQEQEPEKKYTVCYDDRFLGLVESDIVKFVTSSEVPLHRIQLFKCDGEIIWDRKKRFTAL